MDAGAGKRNPRARRVMLRSTERLIQSTKVDFLAGYSWSNVLLASLKPAADSKTFLIGTNAGPSQIAGELCSPFFFSTGWQTDQTPMALGEILNRRGVKQLYALAPNFAGGKDNVAGVKRTYKGNIVGEDYTRFPENVDFNAELAKVRAQKPDAVFVFYPGQHGVQFFQQYAQAGLKTIPLYSVFTVEANLLSLFGDLAAGHLSTQSWVQDLDNPANKKFVSDFRKKYGRYPPYYAAQAYDGAMLIASAVAAVKGDLSNKDAIRDALRQANFNSVRGSFKFNNNQLPIQNFYLQEVVKDDEGKYTLATREMVFKDHQDPFHDRCPMKW
jgi:branched-chain amino acid transport system substrate-binding protein